METEDQPPAAPGEGVAPVSGVSDPLPTSKADASPDGIGRDGVSPERSAPEEGKKSKERGRSESRDDRGSRRHRSTDRSRDRRRRSRSRDRHSRRHRSRSRERRRSRSRDRHRRSRRRYVDALVLVDADVHASFRSQKTLICTRYNAVAGKSNPFPFFLRPPFLLT